MRRVTVPARITVLPRPVRDARAEAGEILARARAEADAIRAAAHAEAERVRETARREGLAEANAETSALRARAAAESARIDAETRAAVATLALDVARTILGREAETTDGVLRDVTQRALSRVKRARRVVLRVHPDDAAVARAHAHSWLPAGLHAEALAVEPDPQVGRGGVIADTDVGRLDARLESQLDAIARALKDP